MGPRSKNSVVGVLIIMMMVLMAKAATSDTNNTNREAGAIKRTFVTALDNATIEILKECEDTRGEHSYTLFDVHSPANNRKPPMHHHTVYMESVEVLSGIVYFEAVLDKGKKNEIVKLQKGDTFVVPANQVHKWWTEDEGSAFRVMTTPCFDGFHEGLELVANAVRAYGIENGIDDHTTHFAPYDQSSIIQKTRFNAILWVMMATEIDEGMMASLLGLVFTRIAGMEANVQMAADLRTHFLPHLKKSEEYQQETMNADADATNTGDEL